MGGVVEFDFELEGGVAAVVLSTFPVEASVLTLGRGLAADLSRALVRGVPA